MRSVTINVYQYNKLESAAKQKALDDYRARMEYPWHDENDKSLAAFMEHIGMVKGSVRYEYGC